MTQSQLLAAKSLVAAVTKSDSANSFCRNLVHSVFFRFGANSALICKIDDAAKLKTVGSYGLEVGVFEGNFRLSLQATPIFQAIRNLELTTFPSLDGEMKDLARAAGLDPNYGALALPLLTAGLVSGAVMITFDGNPDQNPLAPEIAESLQVAAGHFLEDSVGGSGIHRTRNGLPSVSQIPDALSDRQLLILSLLEQPITYAQIGKQLHVSESLVKQESGRIFRFLGVNTRRDAVEAATEKNLLRTIEALD